jgi:hypothetical protein
MTVSNTKLQRHAVSGDYGLSVNDVALPSRISALRSDRPSFPFKEVGGIAYGEVDDTVEWLIGTMGFPDGVARALVVQLYQKVHAAGLRN